MKANFETYATISIDDLPKVDFDQVGQTSAETVRRSVDFTKFILSWCLDFCEGNIIKYIVRYKYKNGLEDLYKARKYLDLLIKEKENKSS